MKLPASTQTAYSKCMLPACANAPSPVRLYRPTGQWGSLEQLSRRSDRHTSVRSLTKHHAQDCTICNTFSVPTICLWSACLSLIGFDNESLYTTAKDCPKQTKDRFVSETKTFFIYFILRGGRTENPKRTPEGHKAFASMSREKNV